VERDLWIFGYGSLVWRPDFSFAEACAGILVGWKRRFWQGSTDHRGVPEAPGRVVTLVESPGDSCGGVAFRVACEQRDAVLSRLDSRESGGFDRCDVSVTLRRPCATQVRAITYIAPSYNPNYLGPAPVGVIAAQVRASRGPSGHNAEYVLRLANSLRTLGLEDEHVFTLAGMLEL
jgi:cation transport regulator ChaC